MSQLTRVLDLFRPNSRIYLPGSTGASLALLDVLAQEPDRAAGVHFLGCFVPGMNEFDPAALHPRARVTTFMLPRAMHQSFTEGRVDLVPASYYHAARFLEEQSYDVAIAQVSPPDAQGWCSLGIASDFAPLAWPKAAARILIINPAMPAMARGPRIGINDATLVVEADSALIVATPSPTSKEVDRIATAVAALIPDGATIQSGIGGVPGAVFSKLLDHKDLVLRSGMANDDLRELAEARALAPAGGHQVGIAYGSVDFYNYLAKTDLVSFATTLQTHDSAALSAIPRFHAVNSALEVDLFGQVNVEWQAGRISSGVGGAANFVRAALASPGGRSIVAMPATAKGGAISRIVPRLSSPAVGMPRTDIDVVATEHGVASVGSLGMDHRAEALIALAAPAFRSDLEREWRLLRTTF